MARKRMFKNVSGFDEYLRKAYCAEKKTMAEIGNELSCTPAAVLSQLRRCDIETRRRNDYSTSEEVRERCRDMGYARKGVKLTDDQKLAISSARTGIRKRDDYDFGGHEKKRDDGYISVYVPEHPNATAEGYVMKHRLVMEKAIGIYIPQDFVVHLVNHIRDDNRIENLSLMTFKAHASLHMTERRKEKIK